MHPPHLSFVRSSVEPKIIYLSNPKPEHTTGGSRRGGARRSGGAGRDRVRQDADGTVRPGALFALWGIVDIVLNDSSEARTNEFLSKPMEKQSQRLTSG